MTKLCGIDNALFDRDIKYLLSGDFIEVKLFLIAYFKFGDVFRIVGFVINDNNAVMVYDKAVHSTLKNYLFAAFFKRFTDFLCRDVDGKAVFFFDTFGRGDKLIRLALQKAVNIGFADNGKLFF